MLMYRCEVVWSSVQVDKMRAKSIFRSESKVVQSAAWKSKGEEWLAL